MKKLPLLLIAILLRGPLSAQTGGPGQPEFMQFQQAGTSDLVNPASGTFSYQIHLFSIGGYPMNLTYQSGVLMEDVASMVGLGWNVNAGCVNRTMRFLPDDFNGFLGDTVVKVYSVAPNKTYGGKIGTDLEFTGKQKKFKGKMLKGYEGGLGLNLSLEWGLFYNSYKGWGMERSISGAPLYSFCKSKEGHGASASLAMGASVNSQNGAERFMTPSLGFKYKGQSQSLKLALGHTWSVNSVEGQKRSLNVNMSAERGTGVMTKGPQDKGKGTETSEESASTSLMGYSHNSYLNNSFQSNIDYPFVNESGTFSGTLGWDYYYLDPSLRITGYFSSQKLLINKYKFPAFGTMYESRSMPDSAMLDYNVEKQMPYLFGESEILPIPFRTPDVFNLSAQGLAMSFSAVRSDIGMLSQPSGESTSSGVNLGVEMGFGDAFKAGANLGTNGSWQRTGKLPSSFFVAQPGQRVGGTELYKQWYFKNLGEVNKFNASNFDVMGGHGAVQIDILDEKTAASTFTNGKVIDYMVTSKAQGIRQTNIEYLTAGEADTTAFGEMLTYHEFGNPKENIPDKEMHARRFGDEKMPYRKAHHLSMIKVTQPDGMRYEFGLASYNIEQKEVSFNASGLVPNAVNNLVRYESEGDYPDNSILNQRGIDHFFESTTTPAYATQFLITAVLGSDYRDLTGDGISEDDPGDYVKFDYYKESQDYDWRTPFGQETATFNAGLHSDVNDDRGSYLYGSKELWYLREIESKIEVAEFHYSPRKDAFGVVGENGGKDTKKFLRQLDSIVVFSLPDRRNNGSLAVPIKTIHFLYDNSLCSGIDNGENSLTGKSTLVSVWFTYGNSQKGKLSPYLFEYGKISETAVMNPSYDVRDENRWGYYQPNPESAYSDCIFSDDLSNIDHPYASQDKEKMDEYAHAWNLTGITIPGGGELSVGYESHAYAYVQDKVAGQMIAVSGISSSDTIEVGKNELYFHKGGGGHAARKDMAKSKAHSRIYFKLNTPLTATPVADRRSKLQQTYIRDLAGKYLYYNFYVELSPKTGKLGEFVSGYALVTDYGVTADGLNGYIDTAEEQLDDDKEKKGMCSAMLRNALQYMRINCNNLIYENFMAGVEVHSFKDFIGALKSARGQMSKQAQAFRQGVNMYSKTKKFCHVIDLDKSFIRLYSPDQFKLAGGSRVKKVSIDDNWDEMIGNTKAGKSYTTEYSYTTERQEMDGTKRVISSGVADYEPLVGGADISLKQPIFYSDEKKKAPDTEYYVEVPVNESQFPAPQITYSKVTEISNPSPTPTSPPSPVPQSKTGRIEHHFFTALEFPVIVSCTGIDQARDKSGEGKFEILRNPISQTLHDFAMVSQGFSIETNNMSGMPKATWVYNENGELVSGEVSEYFSSNHGMTTIDSNGTIHRNSTLGLSVLHTIEGRRSQDQTYSSTACPNFNVSIPFVPIPIMVPLFSQVDEEKQFQSLVTNKRIERNAILWRKTIYSQSASITTENLAFDEVTGEALLTKTTNEFNDTLFSFKYPAWWKYAGMGPAYENSKLEVDQSNYMAAKKFLKVGDELRARNSTARIWVKDPHATAVNTIFMDDAGNAVNTLGSNIYIVYNSGAKNLLSSPMGQVVTWKWNPILHGNKIDFSGDTVVLNSSAVEYYDDAVLYCDTCSVLGNRFGKNDYLSGKKRNYKPWRTWFHLADRSYTDAAGGKTDLQKDGLFVSYNDFWLPPAIPGDTWAIDRSNWEWKERVNLTDVDGQTIETEDRIGRLSTNLLGYCNNLVIAQAVNAGYGETYFDGFEDYNFSFCGPLRRVSSSPTGASSFAMMMTINAGSNTPQRGYTSYLKRVKLNNDEACITREESHTGKYALKVASALSFTIDPPTPCSEFAATFSGTGWTTNTGVPSTGNTGYTLGSGAIVAPGGGAVMSTPVSTTPAISMPAISTPAPGTPAISAPAPGMPAISTPAPGMPAISAPAPGTPAISTPAPGMLAISAPAPGMPAISTPAPGMPAISAPAPGTPAISAPAPGMPAISTPAPGMLAISAPAPGTPVFSTTAPGTSAANTPSLGTSTTIVPLSIVHIPASFGPPSCIKCIGGFNPLKGKDYIFSAWVKVNSPPPVVNCADAKVTITEKGKTLLELFPQGPVIEGWQRMEGKFSMGLSSNEVTVTLLPGDYATFYDDLRIFPADGNMASYVYDDVKLKLTYTLDENNYFTKYEYNNQGELIRIKQETEEGIVTEKEGNSGLAKR